MTMGEDDCFRSGSRTEARIGRGGDFSNPAGQSGVNQDPLSAGSTDEIDVGEADRKPTHVRRDSRDQSHRSWYFCGQVQSLAGIFSVWPALRLSGSSIFFSFAARMSL